MTNQCTGRKFRMRLRRTLAGLLALVLVCGLLPAITPPVQAASWAQEYLDTLVAWGVMRGDINGNLNPDRNITRAEFVTMMNRAYGYDEVNGNPFTDISIRDWYYDDIDTAYNVGYFTGTSSVTATPNGNLTREQAVVLLGRNMMLQESTGETLGFTDSRSFSDWARGYIPAAVSDGIITGMADGSFQPQRSITRAEVAAMLVRAIGTLVQTPGDHNLGNVYGNVTINTSGVNLRNTVITGDLYLTGGIGLGNVLLENVTVMGKIVTSGAGESNSADSSVILRNVTANEMVVDSINNQFVTVRSEGDTSVNLTSVRTNAYIEDAAPAGYGLKLIQLDGEAGTLLQMAGNIKEIVNMTPASRLEIAQGSADKITIDEKAVNSTLTIDSGARVGELDLDVGTSVNGGGDIASLNVSASGCVVSILPDEVTIRPGITANIQGTSLNNETAAEFSSDPRLLAGYPTARDIAPTSATLVFSPNKAGTIYWAISALADGSVDEESLISPPAYGGIIVKSGSITATASKTEYTAKVTGLISDGSYYITAVLVDSRGQRSPLKVNAFTTPDDTVPAFATGYPVMSKVTNIDAQVTVMPTKSCLLYYAVLPTGSAAPKAQDFKANAITGNLGYGAVDVVKNTTLPINVNNIPLEELKTYDLYLWLTDYDGAKSSAVRKITFTTVDGTPPVIMYMEQTDALATSVKLTYALNEPGTVYWAIVKEGNDFLRPLSGETVAPELTDTAAKSQVEAGLGALKKGSSTASKAETDIALTITGLTGETSYDVYYVAKDKAGNYSESVQVITVSTLDNNAPTVTQEFDPYNGDNVNEPLANSSVRLVFSESVQGVRTVNGQRVYDLFANLYKDVQDNAGNGAALAAARQALADALKQHFTMYVVPAVGAPAQVAERTADNESDQDLEWVIDYRYATVGMEDGKMVITFPTTDNLAVSALHMGSGTTYYFQVNGIADTAIVPNVMGNRKLPEFRTVFAQVAVNMGTSAQITSVTNGDVPKDGRIDMNFVLDPTSTDRVEETMLWDMLIWTDTDMTYELYSRPWKEGVNNDPWTLEGTCQARVSANDDFVYYSYRKFFVNNGGNNTSFEAVKTLSDDMEYAIHVTKIGDSDDPTAWNQRVTVEIMVVAGSFAGLSNLAGGNYESNWETAQAEDGVTSIGIPDPRIIRKQFTDTKAPNFVENYPTIEAGDIGAEVTVMLDRPGQVYYVAVPLTNLKDASGSISTTVELTETLVKSITEYSCAVLPTVYSGGVNDSGTPEVGKQPLPKNVPTSGGAKLGETNSERLLLSAPGISTITSGRFTGNVRYGSSSSLEANVAGTITIGDLLPNTAYYLYLVTRGTSAIYSDYAECYRFTTQEAVRPTINVQATGDTVNVEVDRTTDLTYFLALNGSEGPQFMEDFWTELNTGLKAAPTDDPSCAGVTTVLQAMATPCYNGSLYLGSVFDVYATQTAKNTYAALIRSQSVSGNQIVMTGSKRVSDTGNATTANQIKCTGMTGVNYYTFICVGKSTMGSGDAFRAYYPVRQSDTTPPMVANAIITVKTWDDAEAGKIKEGVISIVFSEGLYAVSQSTTTQTILPVDNCNLNADGHADASSKYVAVGSLVTTTANSGVTVNGNKTHSTTGAPISTIELDVNGVKNGFGISFNNTITDEAGNGLTRAPLTVTINVTRVDTGDKDADGKPVYEYVASLNIPKVWDGRS